MTWDLVREIALACARLPRCAAPPTAPVDDVLGAAARLPRLAEDLDRLAGVLRPRVAGIRAIQRHGDLWTGNVVVDGGRLRGIVDWDAAHAHGVPGADLVQLVGTDMRRRARRSLGREVLQRPWRSAAFAGATAGYWRALGTAPEAALLDIAGVAWWAAEIHHTLLRFPQRADRRAVGGRERRRAAPRDHAPRRGSQRSMSRCRARFQTARSEARLTRQK